MTEQSLNFLTTLEQVIEDRISGASDRSYTASLAAAGDRRVAQKVGEEAVELALASIAGDRREQIDEAADLIYHTLVLLRLKKISLADVVAALADRHKAA